MLARLWYRFRATTPQQSQSGFTLTELLVVMLLAGGIVSGALHLASSLLRANQQDMTRTQVQRDLQRSLNYIAEDLQHALYVYDGSCLGPGQGTVGLGGCPGLSNHLPTSLVPERDRYPVLAFWRLSPLPSSLQQHCRQGRLPTSACQSQHTYTLVVYVISALDDNGIWQGDSRLQRYRLNKFRQSGDEALGYVDPSRFNNQFQSWPWYHRSGSAAPVNQQQGRPPLRGNAPVPLVDFIDFSVQLPRQAMACPKDYRPTAAAAVLAHVDSVFGCISDTPNQQRVIVRIRGRLPTASHSSQSTSLPFLQTEVFTRSRLQYLPTD
ncbi:MAG: prepilin-type N-terminal cleavage/methylation domain-containing protein [Elainellaceae cyanobacterium]